MFTCSDGRSSGAIAQAAGPTAVRWQTHFASCSFDAEAARSLLERDRPLQESKVCQALADPRATDYSSGDQSGPVLRIQG